MHKLRVSGNQGILNTFPWVLTDRMFKPVSEASREAVAKEGAEDAR